MIVRFRLDDLNEVHARVSVFSGLGDSDSTLGHSGQLVLDTALWEELQKGLPRKVRRVTVEVSQLVSA